MVCKLYTDSKLQITLYFATTGTMNSVLFKKYTKCCLRILWTHVRLVRPIVGANEVTNVS